jgi:hypothetical protein
MKRWVERLAILVVSLAISVGVIALLSGGLLAGNDDPGVSAGQDGPGTRIRDQGDLHLRLGELRPVYDSDPPTSGAHIPQAVGRDRSELSDNQLLQALEVGDVILIYGTPQPPGGLAQIAQAVGGRFTPALALSGQAVILARRPGTRGVIALAWTRMLHSLTCAASRSSGLAEAPRALHLSASRGQGAGRTATVARARTHTRPASSEISTSHTHVVRPRWRARATAWMVPAVIGRRKLVCVENPAASLPSSLTARPVPAVASDSAIAAYTPPWTRPAGCLSSSRTPTRPHARPSVNWVITRP